MVVLAVLISACARADDPCAGEPHECRVAVETAITHLGTNGRARVESVTVQPEADCALIDPDDTRRCPEDVVYAVRVTLNMSPAQLERFPFFDLVVAQFRDEPMAVTWDGRGPPAPP